MRVTRKFIFAAAINGLFALNANAQGNAAASPTATVEGIAVDSLHQSYLRGAILTVEGAEARATTDASGRFRLENIPPGTRRIEVIHPLLDTIGVSLVTAPLNLTAGQKLNLVISTPSVETLLGLKCTPAERQVGPLLLLGTVEFADSESPAAGAKVELQWSEHRIESKSISVIPRTRSTVVGSDGHFKFCGLPPDFAAEITAIRGNDSTSAIEISLGAPVGMIGLVLPDPQPVIVASLPRAGRAVLTGRVVDSKGSPLARARVSVADDTAFAVTGDDGRFTIRNLHAGTRDVSVRRLGFQPTERAVALRNSRPTDITVRLGDFVALLDTVTIRAAARQIDLDRVGFTKRQALASGWFLTPQEIDKRNVSTVGSLLQGAPMLRIIQDGLKTSVSGRGLSVNVGANSNTTFSGTCVSWVVDGTPWYGVDVQDFISPQEVAAIEVYSKNFTPSQFRTGLADCETVVLWTKSKIH